MADERKTNPIKSTEVQKGHLMAFIYYGVVEDVPSPNNLKVRGIAGAPPEFGVQGESLITGAFSADQFAEEVKVTMTKAAEILTTSFNRPFTVCFVKQDESERKIRGRLLSPEPLLGRSHVEDLDVPAGQNGVRLVDHRTIRWLVADGVKYVVKK